MKIYIFMLLAVLTGNVVDGKIRSLHSRQVSLTRFVNKHSRMVSIFWHNYQGNLVKYSDLPPNGVFNVRTFVTHPWSAIDKVTGENVLIENKKVYYPKYSPSTYNTVYIGSNDGNAVDGTIKSLHSKQVSLTRFVNKHYRKVAIFWHNYQGKLVKYSELQPNGVFNVRTYVTHPWTALDLVTGKNVLIENKKVYYPKYSPSTYNTVYIGSNEVDPCSTNPCKNNGICEKEKNGFKCICPDVYTGKTCENKAPVCRCSGHGDPHYKTFDGQMIDFFGGCKYTLASYKDDRCEFQVEAKHEYRGSKVVSYVRLIDFKYRDNVYRLHKHRNFYFNGIQKYPPFTHKDGVNVTQSGNKLRLTAPCGVLLEFDGDAYILLEVPKSIGKAISGICGTCNGLPDDLKTKDGQDVSHNPNKNSLIGNSYEVPDDSDLIINHCKPAVDVGHPCHSTTLNLKHKAEVSHCRLINPRLSDDSIFKKCLEHDKSIADLMFQSCVFDFCVYYKKTNSMDNIVCESLEGFSDRCQSVGLYVDWRNASTCPMPCPENSVYNYRTSACPRTCVDPNGPDTCKRMPVEGCECKPGYLLSNWECVPSSKCGCERNNGEYVPIGKTIETADCLSKLICKYTNGKASLITEARRPCGTNAICSAVDGHYNCQCKSGFEGDPFEECAEEKPDCKTTISGKEYSGKISTTESGRQCQRWDSNTPHNPNYRPSGQANYCRNPDGSAKPWCYTVDAKKRWEYCDIPLCEKWDDCKTTVSGKEYSGKISTTESGRQCQRWDSNTPHNPNYRPSGQANYCRNPDGSAKPWCYTMDENKRWEYCDIPLCKKLDDCTTTEQGLDYSGKINVTETGRQCQSWDSDTPHSPNYKPPGQANYCRNPDKSKKPWCYTTDKKVRWEYCYIPVC